MVRIFASVVLLVFIVGAASCGRAHLFYDARELRHPAFSKDQKGALAQDLAGKLAGKTLVWTDAEGKERRVATTEAGLNTLGLAELGAVWLVLSTGDNGAEADVRVRTGTKKTPITVLVDLDGNVRLETGTIDVPDEPALSESEIRDRFQLEANLPGKWEDAERRALTESLALLDRLELNVVKSIPFDRESRSPSDPNQAALYSQTGCKARIYLYATGIKSDRFRFMGSAGAPRSAVLHSLVHEIGHAVAAAPARKLYCDAERKPKQRNEMIGRANDMMFNSPVVVAYVKVQGGEPAPTDYGNESDNEAFAESFALFHVDPDALKRARPKVYAWFKSGGPLKFID